MAARVRLFSRSHPSTEPTYKQVLGRLEAGLARAEAFAARQVEGRVKSREAKVPRDGARDCALVFDLGNSQF